MSHRIRQRTLAEFAEWAVGRDLVPAAPDAAKQWRQRIEILINGRADYLDKPDPALWKSGDVHELLMAHAVTRQFDAWNLAEHAPSAVREFLRFLDETDRLHPSSTRVSALLKELDRLTPAFPTAMADSSRWRLAKRVYTAMLADGVRLDDEAEVDRWARRFRALGPEERRGVLGDLMDDDPDYGTGALLIHEGQVAVLRPGRTASKHDVWPDAPCGCRHHGELPAVALPAEVTLAEMVAGRGSGTLRRLVTLGRWVGDNGRPVDRRGELPKAQVLAAAEAMGLPSTHISRMHDLPALMRLWRLALELDLISLRRTKVMPGFDLGRAERVLRGEAEPGEALALWAGLYDELVDPFQSPGATSDAVVLREWLRVWMPQFLVMVFTRNHDGGWSELDELIAHMLDGRPELIPVPGSEVFVELASLAVLQPMADLAEHGAVEISPSPAELRDRFPPTVRDATAALGTVPWALSPVPGIKVRLTDLGRYAVRESLVAGGARIPLAEPAPSRAWVARHDDQVAAAIGAA